MAAHVIHPTPYPDINAVLNVLLSSVQTVLGDHFVGMYLYGSLASGDFNPETSDIDFLVVTADEIPNEMVRDLEAMHIRLMSSDLKWAIKLEGAYIPQHAIRRHECWHF
jgi:predicted nucleotidyltransferase